MKDKKEKINPIKKKFEDIKNTKKNLKIIRSSPYASLELSLKVRKIIIWCLIPFLLFKTYDMVANYSATGLMGMFTRLVMIGVMAYVCWKIYRTIPMAEKQLEYYKKHPHLINYCPTDAKVTIDEIFKNIEDNKNSIKSEEDKKNVRPKEN